MKIKTRNVFYLILSVLAFLHAFYAIYIGKISIKGYETYNDVDPGVFFIQVCISIGLGIALLVAGISKNKEE